MIDCDTNTASPCSRRIVVVKRPYRAVLAMTFSRDAEEPVDEVPICTIARYAWLNASCHER